jgi:hypothetical protein
MSNARPYKPWAGVRQNRYTKPRVQPHNGKIFKIERGDKPKRNNTLIHQYNHLFDDYLAIDLPCRPKRSLREE